MTEQHEKITFKSLLNPITLLTGIIMLVGLILISMVIFFLGRDPMVTAGSTPEITMIPAPTLTPRIEQPTAEPSPTATSVFFLPEGVIGIGAYVQVSGTAGAGLRMRAQPGLDGALNFTAMDSEVFLVIDGPVEADGYTWWHLEAPYDQQRNGWSAGEFLTAIIEDVD